MPCATAKKDGSSRYASSIRARSTRLAGSVRERAIAPNAAKSSSPIANSIACRHAVMSSTLSANQSRKPRTHVGKCESSTYDRFHGIDVLARNLWLQGLPVQAIERARKTLEETARTDHAVSRSLALLNAISIFLWNGDLMNADDHIELLTSHNERHSFGPFQVSHWLGLGY